MKKLLTTALCVGIFSFGLLPTANATLEVRLGGKAVYDTDLDITWLADANYAQTSGYNVDGRMTWSEASTWVASLVIGGVSNWRLPIPDTICGLYFNCTNSELGHLFYNELGGTAESSILSSSDPDLVLFINIQSDVYWANAQFDSFQPIAWDFFFFNGVQNLDYRDSTQLAWPVHSGDVGLIPEPEIYAMLLVGLLAILGFVRLRQQSK